MIHVVRFAQYMTRSPTVVLEGEGDIAAIYEQFKKALDEQIGPEPNLLCYGQHHEWLLKKLKVITESDFIQELVERHGFVLVEHKEYVL